MKRCAGTLLVMWKLQYRSKGVTCRVRSMSDGSPAIPRHDKLRACVCANTDARAIMARLWHFVVSLAIEFTERSEKGNARDELCGLRGSNA